MRINAANSIKASVSSPSTSSTSSSENPLIPGRGYLTCYYESVRQDENWRRIRRKKDDEQIEIYIRWLNVQFSKVLFNDTGLVLANNEAERLFARLKVSNLVADLSDGLRVIYLLDIIYGETLIKEFGDKKLGCLKLHKIKNHDTCIKYLKSVRKIKCIGINAMDLADGNQKMFIGLLFLIKHDQEVNLLNPNNFQIEHKLISSRNNCDVLKKSIEDDDDDLYSKQEITKIKRSVSRSSACQSFSTSIAKSSNFNANENKLNLNLRANIEILVTKIDQVFEEQLQLENNILKHNYPDKMNEISTESLVEMGSDFESTVPSQIPFYDLKNESKTEEDILSDYVTVKRNDDLSSAMEDSGYGSVDPKNTKDSSHKIYDESEISIDKDYFSERDSNTDLTEETKKFFILLGFFFYFKFCF